MAVADPDMVRGFESPTNGRFTASRALERERHLATFDHPVDQWDQADAVDQPSILGNVQPEQ